MDLGKRKLVCYFFIYLFFLCIAVMDYLEQCCVPKFWAASYPFLQQSYFLQHLKKSTSQSSNSSESPFGKLSIPSDFCLQHFKEVEFIVRSSIEKASLQNKLIPKIMSRLHGHTFVTPLQLCSTQLITTIHFKYVKSKVFNFYKWENRRQVNKNFRKNRKLSKVSN